LVQLQFLNKILETGDSSALLMNNLNADYFSSYPAEFNFIVEHLNKYNKVPDKYTFLSKFPQFDTIVVHESMNYLIDELYKDKNARELALNYNKVKKFIEAGDVDSAIAQASKISEIAVQAKHMQSVDLLTDKSRYSDYIERCYDFNKYYVPTGLKELDKIIGGWDRQEELTTIIARSGQGKTWMLLKSAIASLEAGLRVGIYSGEMSARKVGYRIDTLISHISNTCISKGNDMVQNKYKEYIDNLGNRYTGCLKVLTPAMIDGPAGVTALRAFIEKENLDILFVDQHSLLEDDRKARNPIERAANISKDLKNLQVLKKIPIIAVSQQNRESTENGVDTSHISQSDRIGQDSTLILAIAQTDDIYTVKIIKSRDAGGGQTLKYAVDFDKGIWSYMPDGNDKESVENLRQEFEDYGEDIY